MKWGALLLLLLAAVEGWGQQSHFEARTSEVLVPVSVLTKAGKPVEDLSERDFLVQSDGAVQKIRLIRSSDAAPLPIYAVLVIQADEGSQAALGKIRKTASVFTSYITNDMDIATPSLTAVVAAGDEAHVVQEFTADANTLVGTFNKFPANGGGARLIDGVNLACDLLAARKESARRLIVLISGTRDSGSKARFADVLLRSQRENITVDTLSYSAFTTAFTQKASDRPPPPDQPGSYDPSAQGGMNLLALPMLLAQLAKTNVSEAFARSTGGDHGKFTTLHGAETQLIGFGTAIHNRYTLVFVPPGQQKPGYHDLLVTLRRTGEFNIHARPGYWTTGPQ